MSSTPDTPQATIAALEAKVDALSENLCYLVRRQRALDELRDDMIPLANEVMGALTDELSVIDREFSIEDVYDLLRRLMRNTRNINELFDQVMGLKVLVQDVTPLSTEVLSAMVEVLDRLEREGHMDVLRAVITTADTALSTTDPAAVRALGANLPGALDAAAALTDPQVLELARSSIAVLEADHDPVGPLGLLTKMRDPDVQRGMGVMFALLEHLGASARKLPATR